MVKYAYAERVTKKVRKLLKLNKFATSIMRGVPDVDLDDDFCLSSLSWNYYGNSVYVGSTGILLEVQGQRQCLLQYSDFDALLKM